ncbi:MAG: hypothetical protein ACLRWQ_04855 [Flavonifractor plautii]
MFQTGLSVLNYAPCPRRLRHKPSRPSPAGVPPPREAEPMPVRAVEGEVNPGPPARRR